MNTLVFDIETVPDVAFGRRLYQLGSLPDAQVAKAMFARRRQDTGGDFLPPEQQRVVAISCALRSGEGFTLWSLGELGTPVHLLHGPRGDVEIMPFYLTGLGSGFVDRLHAVEKSVAPVHERLRVDVLIVLEEVETALQPLVHDAAVALPREAKLRLGRRAEQRPAKLVKALAFSDQPGRRALERLHI